MGAIDVAINDADTDKESLWEHVEACTRLNATKGAELRAALSSKLGKVEATRLLRRCGGTVARGADGHKKRVLKSPCGQLLKLRP